MLEYSNEYARFFTALLVILDPFAAVPFFLTMTQGYSVAERRRISFIAALAVAAVLIVTAFTGESILQLMGTSLASFRVGGGIVLILMAVAMLKAQPDQMRGTSTEAEEAASKTSIAVVPLAIPLLAGPGSISTVIIEVHRGSGVTHLLTVIGIIIAVVFMLWMVLRLAVPIGAWLGNIGLNILNRLFGLILIAIAVEIMASGLKQIFPALAG